VGRGGRLARSAAADGIEFVAPRTGLFGTGFDVLAADVTEGPSSFGDEPPRHRWGTAIAALAVVGLIAVGVVAAAPWDGGSTPAPSTLPTASTVPATTPTSAPGDTPDEAGGVGSGTLPPGLNDGPTGALLDPADVPAGYELQWVSRPGRPQTSNAAEVRVWAMPNATRTSGSWFALEVVRVVGSSWRVLPADGAARTAVGDGIGTSGVDQDGVAFLQWAIDDRHDGRITAHGWDVGALTRIAEGMVLDGEGEPVFADPSFLDGHRLIHAAPGQGWGLSSELTAWTRAMVAWVGPRDRVLTLATLDADPGRDKTLYDLVLAPVEGQPFTGPKTFWAVGDLTLVVGHLAESPGITVKWTVGDATMLLTGDLPAVELAELAARVHVGTSTEWAEALRQSRENDADEQSAIDHLMGAAVADGSTADGGLTWQVHVSADGDHVSLQLTAGSGSMEDGGSWGWYLPLDAEPNIRLATTPRTTYAAAVLPAGSDAAALVASGPWGTRSEPFVRARDTATGVDLLVGVMDVPEVGGVRIEAVDASGAVIATVTAGALTT